MEDTNGALDAKLMLVPLDNRRGVHLTLRTGAAVDEDYVVEPSRPWLVISAPGTAEEGRAKPSLFFLPDVRQLSHRPGARTEARGVFPDILEVQVPVTLFVGISRLRVQQKAKKDTTRRWIGAGSSEKGTQPLRWSSAAVIRAVLVGALSWGDDAGWEEEASGDVDGGA